MQRLDCDQALRSSCCANHHSQLTDSHVRSLQADGGQCARSGGLHGPGVRGAPVCSLPAWLASHKAAPWLAMPLPNTLWFAVLPGVCCCYLFQLTGVFARCGAAT